MYNVIGRYGNTWRYKKALISTHLQSSSPNASEIPGKTCSATDAQVRRVCVDAAEL